MARSQSVVKTPLHPFYLHLILYYLYIRLFYTHSLYTLFTLCINHYYHFVCILRLHPCAKRLYSFQSQFIVYHKQVYKCCNLSREAQLKMNESRGPGERVFGERGGTTPQTDSVPSVDRAISCFNKHIYRRHFRQSVVKTPYFHVP